MRAQSRRLLLKPAKDPDRAVSGYKLWNQPTFQHPVLQSMLAADDDGMEADVDEAVVAGKGANPTTLSQTSAAVQVDFSDWTWKMKLPRL